jgi:hypothetical protein
MNSTAVVYWPQLGRLFRCKRFLRVRSWCNLLRFVIADRILSTSRRGGSLIAQG